MNDCIAVNIQDMLKAIGEEKLSKLLSDFSCPLNREVEDFVRNKSIDFAQRKISITYLVIKRTNEDKNILVGIYTLSHKAIEITNSNISNTTRKKLLRYAALDKDTNKYNNFLKIHHNNRRTNIEKTKNIYRLIRKQYLCSR